MEFWCRGGEMRRKGESVGLLGGLSSDFFLFFLE
jgi:hypothetical protein